MDLVEYSVEPIPGVYDRVEVDGTVAVDQAGRGVAE